MNTDSKTQIFYIYFLPQFESLIQNFGIWNNVVLIGQKLVNDINMLFTCNLILVRNSTYEYELKV